MNRTSILEKINNYKFELIINKNLYIEELISKELYEIVENDLLEHIDSLSNGLEMSI